MDDCTLEFTYPDIDTAMQAAEVALGCDSVMGFNWAQLDGSCLLRVKVAGPNHVEKNKQEVIELLGAEHLVPWSEEVNAHVERSERARAVE